MKRFSMHKSGLFLVTILLVVQLLAFSCVSARSPEPEVSFQTKLESLPAITSVTPYDSGIGWGEEYMATIRQPVSWNDPSKGWFDQRFYIGFIGEDRPTVLYCNGYYLADGYEWHQGSGADFADILNANFISVEYRFFSASTPENFDQDTPDMFKYLTNENASNDLHNLKTVLSEILPEKWVSTGASKGGYVICNYAMSFPDDCAVYAPSSANLCNGREDPRFYEFMYTEAGNSAFGEVRASEYRNLLSEVQKRAVEHEDELAVLYRNRYRNVYPYLSDREALARVEEYIVDFPTEAWMYMMSGMEEDVEPFYFTALRENVLQSDLPESSAEYCEMLLNTICLCNPDLGESPFDEYMYEAFVPYFYQALAEMGNILFDASYVHTIIPLTCSQKEIQRAFYYIPDEMYDAFESVDTVAETRNALIDWLDTTQSHVFVMYGGCDPWRAVGLPVTSNPNVVRIEDPYSDHLVSIAGLRDEALKDYCIQLIKEWMN